MEVDTSITNIYGWIYINRKRVMAGAVAVALVAAVACFYFVHKNQNEAEADEELLKQPLGLNTAEKADPKALLNISDHYPSTSAGADAQLLAAKDLFLSGKFDEANQAFSKFMTEYPGNPLYSRAELGVAACLESAGKIPEAVKEYQHVAQIYSSQPDIAYPVKLTLGRLTEAQEKPDAAVNYYQDLARVSNSQDPWVAEAKERLRMLLAKHPELDKSSGVNPYQTTSPMTPSAADTQLVTPGAAPANPPATAPTLLPGTNPGTNAH
jgi:tetratricopeptide (TPR) repeat protein